jgi:hypothetical protein
MLRHRRPSFGTDLGEFLGRPLPRLHCLAERGAGAGQLLGQYLDLVACFGGHRVGLLTLGLGAPLCLLGPGRAGVGGRDLLGGLAVDGLELGLDGPRGPPPCAAARRGCRAVG